MLTISREDVAEFRCYFVARDLAIYERMVPGDKISIANMKIGIFLEDNEMYAKTACDLRKHDRDNRKKYLITEITISE